MDDAQLRQAILDASARPEGLQAVARLYDELQGRIDTRRPVCEMSGRCCRFEEFGHRLYVTTLELAAFLHNAQPSPAEHKIASGCPFQAGKLCTVHPARPFGCRVFFCDPTARDWQEEQYANLHGRLRQLHETLGVPYVYMEWRDALRRVIFPLLRETQRIG